MSIITILCIAGAVILAMFVMFVVVSVSDRQEKVKRMSIQEEEAYELFSHNSPNLNDILYPNQIKG